MFSLINVLFNKIIKDLFYAVKLIFNALNWKEPVLGP
ncbi:MAG: hypothetical protein ACJAVN_002563, partial [Roseivirga sp.]